MQANFSSEQSGRESETEGVRKLKQLCSELTSRPEAVKDLLAALQDEGADKISTYEFLSSGAVQELGAYLQGDERTSRHDGPSSSLFPCAWWSAAGGSRQGLDGCAGMQVKTLQASRTVASCCSA